MGIYIPGIEKSKTCAFCRFCEGLADTQLGSCAFCVVDGKTRVADTLPKDCPLVPVPDHGRLVDADALLRHEGVHDYKYERETGKVYVEIDDICGAIDNAPTIIPADKEGEG